MENLQALENLLEANLAWYHKIIEKLNPAQRVIHDQSGGSQSSDAEITYLQAFDQIETVNRGVSLIVRACCSLDYDVEEKKVLDGVVGGMRLTTLKTLLNYRPNPFQSQQEFLTHVFTDFVLEGNAFIYYDGAHLFHLPSMHMDVIPDPKSFVAEYIYDGQTHFKPSEIIHIKELSNDSVYRGSSRLKSCVKTLNTLKRMHDFQDNFFKNGAIPGLVFVTENTLSQAAKDKTINYWMQRFSANNGGSRRPMIVDSGLKPMPIANSDFKELDFATSIDQYNTKILNALGVPKVLFDGGNNANINPNLRLFYLETVLPIVKTFASGLERYFGYDVQPIVSSVSALQPDLSDLSSFLTQLKNSGIITANEARKEIRYQPIAGGTNDELIVPQNIAGSAVDSNTGGKPPTKEPKP